MAGERVRAGQNRSLIAALPPHDIFRIVRDLIIDELARSRRRSFDIDSALDWTEDTPIVGSVSSLPGPDLDSLERFTIAARLNEMFRLFQSGVEDNLLRCRTLGETVEVIQTGLREYSATLAFFSGGTTGTPRPVEHAGDRITQEIEEWAVLFSDRQRVIVTIPVHHIYGFLFGVLLPQAIGGTVVEARRSLLTGSTAPVNGDLVISIPFLWERLAAAVPRWGEGVIGVSSTAPLSLSTGRLLCTSGLTRCIEVYGSSETAGIAWRDHCDGGTSSPPFRLLPYWRRDPKRGNTLLRAAPDNSARDTDNAPPTEHDLPDRVEWIDDRSLLPQGRRDSVVQVGGTNVDLDDVRNTIITAVAQVDDCALRLGRDGRIKAFVVLARSTSVRSDSAPPTEAMIRGQLREILPAYAVPTSITIGAEIPRNTTGKIIDW